MAATKTQPVHSIARHAAVDFSRPRCRAVLLDALGTLVNLEPPAPRLRHELRDRFGFSITEEQAQRAIAREIVYYRAHLEEGRDESGLVALRRRCAEIMWSELPGDVGGPPSVDALVDTLLSSLHFTAFDEVASALRALRDLGLTLVVASNWDVSLPDVLNRLRLARMLDGVVTSAEVGARKPRPEIFQRALAVAGVDPDQAVHVGDSLEEDVAGARSAGIDAVLLVRGGSGDSEPGVTTIRTLEELPGLLSA